MKTRQILDKIRAFTPKLAGRSPLQTALFFPNSLNMEDYPLGAELRPYVALLSEE